jgi:hypothetical protein
MATAAGFQSSAPPSELDRIQNTLDLLCYDPKNLPHEDIKGATVKGVVTLEVRRASVAGFIPFQVGACFDGRRTRYQITAVESSDNEMRVNLERFTAPLTLRGDIGGFYPPDELLVMGVYRPFAEQLFQGSAGANTEFSVGVHMFQMDFSFGPGPEVRWGPSGWRPLPGDWQAGAELAFVRGESCGQVRLPYEIDNVDLRSDEPRPARITPSPALLPAASAK